MQLKKYFKQCFAWVMTVALLMTGMNFGALKVSAEESQANADIVKGNAPVAESFEEEPTYEYWFEQNGTLVGVPGWSTDVNKYLEAWVVDAEYPEGDVVDTTIDNIAVNITEGPEDAINVVEWDDNNGWTLEYKKLCEADVTLTYQKIDGTGQQGTHEFHISVSDIAYYMNIFTSTGIDRLLPGSALDLIAEVGCDVYNQDEDNISSQDTSDTVVELVCNTPKYTDYLEISDGDDKNSFHISAKDVDIDGEKGFDFILSVKKDGETVFEDAYWICITNDYYQIHNDESVETDILPIGQSLTVKPQLYHYVKGQEPAKVTENVSYEYESDAEVLQVEEADGLYILTRLRGNWTEIRFIAKITDDDSTWEAADYRMQFQEDNYYFRFENLREEWGTFIFDDETLNLNIAFDEDKKLPEGFQIDWVVKDEKDNPVNTDCYSADNTGIELYGDKLAPLTKEGIYSVCVMAALKNGDEIVSEYEQVNVNLRETMCQFYVINDEDALPYSEIRFDGGKLGSHVESKDFPYGSEIEWTIDRSSIKIEGTTSDFYTFNEEEQNDIIFVAGREGEGTISFDVSAQILNDDGSSVKLSDTIVLRRNIVDELYRLEINSSTGTNSLLKGASLSLIPRLTKATWTEEDGEIWEDIDSNNVEFILDDSSKNGEIVSLNGTEITANDYGDTGVTAAVEMLGGYRAECYMDIHVVDNYYQLFVDNIFAEPGQNVKLPISVKHFRETDPNGVEIPAFFIEYLDIWEGEELIKTIAENKESITIAAEDKTLEDEPVKIVANIGASVDTEHDGTVYAGDTTFEMIICVHDLKEISKKPADCTNDGQIVCKCEKCDFEKTEILPATGHSFGNWSVTKQPTALTEGIETRTCSICGAKETRTVAKLKAFIKLNATSVPLAVKQSTKEIKVIEMAAGDAVASYSSSNPKVATVNASGKITGKAVGKAVITVTLKSGVSASVQVKVQKGDVNLKKLKTDVKKLTLSKGDSYTIQYQKNPVTAKDKVKFVSSDKKVASVNSKGKIKAKKAGKAVITVSCGKKKVKVTVTVK